MPVETSELRTYTAAFRDTPSEAFATQCQEKRETIPDLLQEAGLMGEFQ